MKRVSPYIIFLAFAVVCIISKKHFLKNQVGLFTLSAAVAHAVVVVKMDAVAVDLPALISACSL